MLLILSFMLYRYGRWFTEINFPRIYFYFCFFVFILKIYIWCIMLSYITFSLYWFSKIITCIVTIYFFSKLLHITCFKCCPYLAFEKELPMILSFATPGHFFTFHSVGHLSVMKYCAVNVDWHQMFTTHWFFKPLV